ncbi:MAG: hypothetical protein A2583_01300 [Bdellovibrionales bacterium RIFOXYD1_FULL_53_11]|nr:MAG: hypothetical protein A2583_01300 [Bdellovibrionales bacterium RIFOXYD1_FULL_53_11]
MAEESKVEMKNIFAMFLLLLSAASARGAMKAGILPEYADIFHSPDKSSMVLTAVAGGTEVMVSDTAVRGKDGLFWRKIRAPGGQVGYIKSSDILPRSSPVVMREAGMQDLPRIGADAEGGHGDWQWRFTLRAMGIGGLQTRPSAWVVGGDGEFSYSFTRGERGYDNRRAALGVAASSFNRVLFVTLSVIYRVYTQSRAEPEIRLRMGRDLQSGRNGFGIEGGVRYPLALGSGPQVSLNLAGAALMLLSSDSLVLYSMLAGLGFHI